MPVLTSRAWKRFAMNAALQLDHQPPAYALLRCRRWPPLSGQSRRLGSRPGRAGWQAVEASFLWFAGRPLVLLADAASNLRLMDSDGADVVLNDATIARAAAHLMAATPISTVTRLIRDDAYWSSHHHQRPLPVVSSIIIGWRRLKRP